MDVSVTVTIESVFWSTLTVVDGTVVFWLTVGSVVSCVEGLRTTVELLKMTVMISVATEVSAEESVIEADERDVTVTPEVTSDTEVPMLVVLDRVLESIVVAVTEAESDPLSPLMVENVVVPVVKASAEEELLTVESDEASDAEVRTVPDSVPGVKGTERVVFCVKAYVVDTEAKEETVGVAAVPEISEL